MLSNLDLLIGKFKENIRRNRRFHKLLEMKLSDIVLSFVSHTQFIPLVCQRKWNVEVLRRRDFKYM